MKTKKGHDISIRIEGGKIIIVLKTNLLTFEDEISFLEIARFFHFIKHKIIKEKNL